MAEISNAPIVDFTIETLRSGDTLYSAPLTLKFEDGSQWTGRLDPATTGKIADFDIHTRRPDYAVRSRQLSGQANIRPGCCHQAPLQRSR